VLVLALAAVLAQGPRRLLAQEGPASQPPNILLILCDDMGWRDLSCFGNTRIATPGVDRLAAEGMKLSRFYAACPVCTPTRISILTGKYPLRYDVHLAFRDLGEFLPLDTTLPKLLKAASYRTAHLGKWHLGGVRLKDCAQRDRVPGPREHGFDHYLTQIEEQPLRGDMIKQKTLYRKGGTCLLRDDRRVGEDDPYFAMHFTDILGAEAIRVIRQARDDRRPFFVNLWFMDPHTPYEPAPEPHWSQTAALGITEDQHRFRSMVARMDDQVGRILTALDELKLAENTLVLFSSDNGGAYEANIGDLKGGKTDLHEGGIRVPFLARWPGRIPAGTESSALAVSTDILPTCCAAAGVALPDSERFDGRNLLPLLTGTTPALDRGTVFWQIDFMPVIQRHEPKPKPYATAAARRGRWKLLAFDEKPVELFDVEADPREQINRITEEPEVVESLRRELADWLAQPRRKFGKVD
jgi:N-acetylgalactosamine-6-sulfatase